MRRAQSEFNQQIYEQASDWLVRHREGALDASDKKAFDAWLRASPEHIRAYLEMSAVWEDLGGVDTRSVAPAAELIERAAVDGPVVSMALRREATVEQKARVDSGSSAQTSGKASRVSRHRLRLAAAVATLSIAAGLTSWWLRAPSYSTDIGEQRSITLADGSTVEMNARSEIRVRFGRRERDVALVRGQALFHVAKDAGRPFIVRAGSTLVRAVGTQFDVNELQAGTVVTVVEGLVAVFGGGAAHPSSMNRPTLSDASLPSHEQVAAELMKGLHGAMRPIFVGAGQQLTVTAKQSVETSQVNPAVATAWTHHRFAFDGAPLAEVVTELNRYNARQLVIVDARLEDVRINGLFSSSNPSLLLQFLRSQPGIVVDDTGDEIRISKK
jgi:transmembrane sensor